MAQKPTKSAAELESMIMAELREYPECESAAVAVIGPTSIEAWNAVLVREGPQIILADSCVTTAKTNFAYANLWGRCLCSYRRRLLGVADGTATASAGGRR